MFTFDSIFVRHVQKKTVNGYIYNLYEHLFWIRMLNEVIVHYNVY